MALSKFSYYSDFVVYPIVVAGLTAANYSNLSAPSGRQWLAACLGGLGISTLLEYALHRVALHWMPIFSPMHSEHHGEPLALLGTPSWISVSVWLGVVGPPPLLGVGVSHS